MAHITVITQLGGKKNPCNPNSLVIHAHMSRPWVVFAHTHTHTRRDTFTHTVRASSACPTEGVRVMSQ